MIQSTKSAQIIDLTTLAVRAKNLQAGTASGAVQPKSSAKAASAGRDPAVRLDDRTRQLADAIARRQDTEGASGSTARAARPAFNAQAEMLEARTRTYLHLIEDRKHLTETIRLYEETGRVYSVQPNGNFEMDERALEPHGGAEGFMQDTRRRLERSHKFIADAAKALEGSSSE